MMNAKSAKTKPKAKSAGKKILVPVTVNRRREWRFDLPLTAIVEGKLPKGQVFQEKAKLENISSGGAYFCLDSGVVVGSKLKLVINLPKQIAAGQKLKLQVGGMTVRLEKPDKKGKRQGVAVRFNKYFRFVANPKR